MIVPFPGRYSPMIVGGHDVGDEHVVTYISRTEIKGGSSYQHTTSTRSCTCDIGQDHDVVNTRYLDSEDDQ